MSKIQFDPRDPWIQKLLVEHFKIPTRQVQEGELELPSEHPARAFLLREGATSLSPQKAKDFLQMGERYEALTKRHSSFCNNAAVQILVKRVLAQNFGTSMERFFAKDTRNFLVERCRYEQFRGYARDLGAAQPEHPDLFRNFLFEVKNLAGLGDAAWDHLSSAIVSIQAAGGSATAFHLGEGYFLTARHVIFPNNLGVLQIGDDDYLSLYPQTGQCREGKITLAFEAGEGRSQATISASQVKVVAYFHHYRDELAVIEAPEALEHFARAGNYLTAIPTRETPLQAGETIVVAGFPDFEDGTPRKVALLGQLVATPENRSKIRIRNRVDFGMSGGPCLDSSGRLVGIASTRSETESECLNLTTLQDLPDFLHQALERAKQASKRANHQAP